MSRARGENGAVGLRRGVLLMLALLAAWGARPALGAEIVVSEAQTYLVDKVYHLDARIDYDFSQQAVEALLNGVPLVVQLEIEINRLRDYLWSETVANLRQRYQLAYEALTGRYVITNLNSGADAYYPNLAAAVEALGEVRGLPLLDAGLLAEGERYEVSMRASLDLEALPVPMRIMGYFSSDWRLASEWYIWSLE